MSICRPEEAYAEFKESEIKQSITDRFEKQVICYPNRLAVKTKNIQLTYLELNQTANCIARAILSLRGEKEEPVALMLEQGDLLIAAILGVLKSGKSYVPLDSSFNPERNAYMIEDSGAGLILTDHRNLKPAKNLAGNKHMVFDIQDAISRFCSENLRLPISPDAIAYILYTSGSTGKPKGVFQNHRNVLHNIMKYTNGLHISADDRLTLLYSCSFGASVSDIFGALLNGAGLFPFNLREDGLTKLTDWLIQEKITIYHSVPTVYRHFITMLNGTENLSSLRLIKLGGEPVYKKDLDLYKRHFQKTCIFHVGLGSTEMNIIRQFFCNHETIQEGSIVPVGYAVQDTELLLLDDEGKEVGFKKEGEIAIKSRYLASGYWRNPELTKTFFFPDPEGGSERIFRTGDYGRMLSDGCLVYIGRKDSRVKIRGYRVEASEVEMSLQDIAFVKEAIVSAHKDQKDDTCLVAYVVLRQHETDVEKRLRKFLKDKLPDYMIPSVFVFLEALPLTPNGKVDRKALPEPALSKRGSAETYVSPGTPEEEILAGVWSEVLDIERIGIHDNFFDLGGHSLLMTQVVSRLNKIFNITIPLRSFFEAPTISGLSSLIQDISWQIQEKELMRNKADENTRGEL